MAEAAAPRCNKNSASYRKRIQREIRTLRDEHMKAIDGDKTELADELAAEIKRKEKEWVARTVGLNELLTEDEGQKKGPQPTARKGKGTR